VFQSTLVAQAATTGLCPYALTRAPFLAYPWRSLEAHCDSGSARSPHLARAETGLREAPTIEQSLAPLAPFAYVLNIFAYPSDVLDSVEDGPAGFHAHQLTGG
jgi:hypothetical protein